MDNKGITASIAKYISENNISLGDIQEATHILPSKLKGEEALTALELLELCYFLNIRPEQFRTRKN